MRRPRPPRWYVFALRVARKRRRPIPSRSVRAPQGHMAFSPGVLSPACPPPVRVRPLKEGASLAGGAPTLNVPAVASAQPEEIAPSLRRAESRWLRARVRARGTIALTPRRARLQSDAEVTRCRGFGSMSDKAEDPRTTIAWPSTRVVAPKLRDEAQGWPLLSAVCSARAGKPIALKRTASLRGRGKVRAPARSSSRSAAAPSQAPGNIANTPAFPKRED
jgi:hypothetical protein